MSSVAIYPGTFDPITNGHIDVIERASSIFDSIVIVIAKNPKKEALFTESERLELVKDSVKGLPNVRVEITDTLTVDFAKKVGAIAIIRGIRAVSDFDYEFQIGLMNRKLCPELTTIFLMPNEKYTYLNSSIIRELSRYGADVSDFVPPVVAKKLREKFSS